MKTLGGTAYSAQKRKDILYIPVHTVPEMKPWYINALGVFDDLAQAIGTIMIQIENTMDFDEHDEPTGEVFPLQYRDDIGVWYIEAKDDREKEYTDCYYILEVDLNEEGSNS